MSRMTTDPSLGRFIQCLAKINSNGSIVSVDMDVVGVMAAYLPVVRACTARTREEFECLSSPCLPWRVFATLFSCINGEFRYIFSRVSRKIIPTFFRAPCRELCRYFVGHLTVGYPVFYPTSHYELS